MSEFDALYQTDNPARALMQWALGRGGGQGRGARPHCTKCGQQMRRDAKATLCWDCQRGITAVPRQHCRVCDTALHRKNTRGFCMAHQDRRAAPATPPAEGPMPPPPAPPATAPPRPAGPPAPLLAGTTCPATADGRHSVLQNGSLRYCIYCQPRETPRRKDYFGLGQL